MAGKKEIVFREGVTIFTLAIVVFLVGMVFYLYGEQNSTTGELVKGQIKVRECGDTIDNDFDGLIDFPNDFGCLNKNDPTECTVSPEICDGADNDCNGVVDEITRSCYSGSSETRNVGACHDGISTCTTGAWGTCVGEVTPSTEVCDSKDNDCDSIIDEGCSGPQNTCTDNDGGKAYMTRGTISGTYNGNLYGYTDACVESNSNLNTTVKEYYCTNNSAPSNILYNCVNASYTACKDGACR